MRQLTLALVVALPALAQNDPWTPAAGLTKGSVTVLRSNDANRNILWAGGSGGVFRSDDGGLTWTLKSGGLADPLRSGVALRGLDVFRKDPNVVIAGVGGILVRTEDGGGTWASSSGDPNRVLMLALDPEDSRIFYGVHDAYDGTCWWSSQGASECVRSIGTAFTVDPTDRRVLYGGNLLKSTDGGFTWFRIPAPFPVGFLRADAQGGLWAGSQGDHRARVAWSGDGGVTWEERSAGLPTSAFGYISVADLAFDPKDPNGLAAAVGPRSLFDAGVDANVVRGFYRSVDGGRHWYRVGGHHEALSVAFGRADGEVLAGGLADGGVVVANARPAPTAISISSVLPDSGSIDGGTLLLITGDGFTPWTWVTLGGSEASEMTFFDEHTLRVRTPPGPLGLSDVTVHSATGSTASLMSEFRYLDWATIPVSAGDGALALENGRFLVSAVWLDPPSAHPGQPVSVSQKSGYFWFDFPAAMDVVVKVLDGRTVNGHYWIHWAVLTDRPVQIRVLDRVNPLNQRIYTKSAEGAAAGIDKTSF